MYDAIVLAGGASRRMGGGDKTAAQVGDRPLLDRVLDAVAAADRIVVVGPERPTGRSVQWAREDPPGGGPAAAVAAALPHLDADIVVLLAGDLPFVTTEHVALLVGAASAGHAVALDGAVALDDMTAPQWLCGAWRRPALRRLLDAFPDGVSGLSLRKLFADAAYTTVVFDADGDAPPWFDCDTPADLARAKEHG